MHYAQICSLFFVQYVYVILHNKTHIYSLFYTKSYPQSYLFTLCILHNTSHNRSNLSKYTSILQFLAFFTPKSFVGLPIPRIKCPKIMVFRRLNDNKIIFLLTISVLYAAQSFFMFWRIVGIVWIYDTIQFAYFLHIFGIFFTFQCVHFFREIFIQTSVSSQPLSTIQFPLYLRFCICNRRLWS